MTRIGGYSLGAGFDRSVSSTLVGTSTRGGAAAKALVHRLPALKTGIDGVPVLDGSLAHAPAKQHHFIVEAAGKVEQAGSQVFDLYADGIHLGDALAYTRHVSFNLRALLGHAGDVNPHATRKVDALRQVSEVRLDMLRGLLAVKRAFEQRFEYRQQRLRFFESECLHGDALTIRIRQNSGQ